ncbi:hypothetical protein J6590_080815 [Homalodisca vitripennis]|nr:hypothetical protein J6590_080815 [Homalodisca vitripennis]
MNSPCNKTRVCRDCGDNYHSEECSKPKKCVHCYGPHSSNSRQCPEYIRQKQIKERMSTMREDYFTARHVSLDFNERVDNLARDAITTGVKIPEINVPLEDFKVARKRKGMEHYQIPKEPCPLNSATPPRGLAILSASLSGEGREYWTTKIDGYPDGYGLLGNKGATLLMGCDSRRSPTRNSFLPSGEHDGISSVKSTHQLGGHETHTRAVDCIQRRAELGSSRSIGLSYRRAKGIMPPPENPSTVKTRSMSDSDILSSLSSQLESLGKEMREFREESKSMGKSIDSTHDKIDEVKVLINAQQEDIEKCLDVIDNLKVENSQLQCELEQVKKELCDVQQSSRRNTVDIQGVLNLEIYLRDFKIQFI